MSLPLSEFAECLASKDNQELTLCAIARTAVDFFSFEYCSIHLRGFTGTSSSKSDSLTRLDQLILEFEMELHYAPIFSLGYLAVKTDKIPAPVISTIATMIGIRMKLLPGIFMKVL